MHPEEFQKLVLEMFRELKADMRSGFEQVDKRFEQVDKRFEQVDKRFEQVDKQFVEVHRQLQELRTELKEVKTDIRSDRDKLQQVYEARDKVKITFGWQWGMVSLFVAIVAAGITKLFS